MNILIVNDDGYQAKGLALLIKALAPFGNLYVAAPKEPQSGQSQAITITNKIEAYDIDPLIGTTETLVVNGTPADAVRMGLKFFNVDFDLVVSGINHGVNIASDVLYSGTVAAAIEAKILGIDAIAISAADVHLPYLFDETYKLFDEILETKVYQFNGILNINFPKASFARPQGVKITNQGLRLQHTEFTLSEKTDVYYIKSSLIHYEEHPDSDVVAYENGYISMTPLKLDRTDHAYIKKILRDEQH
ncbi:MAG: 5'/3'-nucleotidase SurE [Acholeplasmataceae bacterium]|nr:5'/3'-nucleotidase SurE [Acholeplasmataceae bacterium]